MTPDDRAGGSQPVVTRARSFDVLVTRVDDGYVVFHAFPITEAAADFFVRLIPRMDSRGRHYVITLKEVGN